MWTSLWVHYSSSCRGLQHKLSADGISGRGIEEDSQGGDKGVRRYMKILKMGKERHKCVSLKLKYTLNMGGAVIWNENHF